MPSFTRQSNRVNGSGGTPATAEVINQVYDVVEDRGVSPTDPYYGAAGDGIADDTAELIACYTDHPRTWIPPDTTLRITSWLPLISNHSIGGAGASSVIYNDKTNATIDKRACLLPGNHHPANMATQTSYALNTIAYGDDDVTCTTAGDAANFSVGELVIVGSATNISGVSRHAQLDKIITIVGAVIGLADPIEGTITDAKIWKISGSDASTSTPIYAIENVTVENLGFKGRSAFATKGATYNCAFRNLHMLDTHLFFGTNMLTNTLIENLTGQYSGRYLEFAFNSYNVTARNWKGRFRSVSALQTGETQVFPIHLGEQPYRMLLDDVQCHIDSRYTQATELAQIKGSKITLSKNDWRHAGSAGSFAINIPDCDYTGYNFDDIIFETCRLSAPSKVRIVQIGEAAIAAENPTNVHFRGGQLLDAVSGESIWFQSGKHFSCSMQDRTGKNIKVSATARYPMLNGYRRG